MRPFFGKEYTDDEFDSMMDQMADWIDEEQTYMDRQRKRVEKFLKKLTKREVDKWFDKFLAWEEKYEDKMYRQGIITSSNIFGAVINYFENNSKIIKVGDEDEMFLSKAFKWKKYTFKLYQGQGCFWRILRKKEIRFQTT